MDFQAIPLDQLLKALEQGWRVQTPVYYRKQGYTSHGASASYYFILKKNNESDLIVVPAGDKTRQLIELQRLKVVAA